MAESSKDLLEFEHNRTPFSSLESALLVCDSKKELNTKIKSLPRESDAPLKTAAVPPSQLFGKVKDFLGVMSEANKRLELDAKDHPKNCDIEELTGNESEVIEMDLMIGVADLHTQEAVAAAESAISSCQPVIQLAADGSESETDSDGSSADDGNVDDEIESKADECDGGDDGEKLLLHAQKSIFCADKQKRNRHSKKRPRIVELS